MKIITVAIITSYITTAFVSCGIEDYVYLYPVSAGNISVELNSEATIRLPAIDTNEYYYFSCFTIYYRIYISDSLQSGHIDEGIMSTLNPTLYSDYNAFLPYINSETTISTSIGTLFSNRNYRSLTLEGVTIDDVLSKDSLGKTIILDFPPTPGTIPGLIINDTWYNLRRSNGNGSFSPLPENRYFLNHPDLNSSVNASSTINADVANISTAAEVRYTYVSLYIVVTGIDSNFSPIYSTPAFIGILRLPDASV
ncbi:MAG: hypothetical protein LBT14_09535 [Treponema sp.]|jgi:hypothetical protein|nr:hypothetical protein [Treponema sp.]